MRRKIPILCLLLLILFPVTSFAEDTKESQVITENEQRAGFTVQAVLPENQINNRISYYHLLVAPNHKQTVEVRIMNSSAEKSTYKVEVINAATNRNGLITYDEREKKPDESMQLPITKIAKPKSKEVTVDALSEGKAEIDISVPSEAFNGIVLGGVRISLKSEDDKDDEKGMSVKNTYGYAIGMILTEKEDTPVYGETELKLTKLQPEIDYGSKVLEASIQNPNPEAMQKLVAEGKIVRKGQEKALAKNKLENVKIAPNSIFPFQIDWGMQEVTAGEYTFIGKVTGENNKWSFKQDFTITREMARKMNKQTAFRIFVPNWWTTSFYLAGIITAAVTAWLVVRLIKRKKGREMHEE